MKSFTFFISLLFLTSANLFSQEKIITGTVTDSLDVPLPYASVILRNSAIGVCTNENGKYELFVTPKLQFDTLEISFIGYNTYKKLIHFNDSTFSHNIKLSQHNIKLQDIVVTSEKLNGKLILLKAIKNLRKNYYKNFYLEGFYREEAYKNDTIGRLIEASAAIKLKSIDFDPYKDKLSIFQLRKSDDMLDKLNWFQKKILTSTYRLLNGKKFVRNGLYELFQKDYPLNKTDLKNYEITITKVLEQENSKVYEIKCRYNKFNNDIISFYYHIDINDFSILQMQKQFKVPNQGFKNDYWEFTKVEFRKIDQKYIPSLIIFQKYGGDLGDKTQGTANGKKVNQFVRKTFLTNNWSKKIGDQRKIFKSTVVSPFEWFSDINFSYNPIFWENYNLIYNDNTRNQKYKFLTKTKKLEQQFIDNGQQ
ncbi:MAG: carboxypeptidase-like regulatory domain-containing protein [Labilibaculum sp.]|nr:carboxypeptidase-like regulatory domain-containing protein [Labilibaculum sp.]MBI9057697.1 carboxypeptidase-like regulatory domain-containing protein [Labilibaculum sp.]